MANQIMLKGDFRRDEALAGAAISPGDLVELNSAGKVIVHATEGGYAERAFAIEDALQGKDLTTNYAEGDLVQYNIVEVGAEVQAFLFAGEDVAIGEKLISNGDGTLVANGSEASGITVNQIVAVAMEALDLSASGAADTRIDVRVL